MFASFFIVDAAFLADFDLMSDSLHDILKLFISIILNPFNLSLTLPFNLLKLFGLLTLVDDPFFVLLADELFDLVG
jgi:hypothetical protein